MGIVIRLAGAGRRLLRGTAVSDSSPGYSLLLESPGISVSVARVFTVDFWVLEHRRCFRVVGRRWPGQGFWGWWAGLVGSNGWGGVMSQLGEVMRGWG